MRRYVSLLVVVFVSVAGCGGPNYGTPVGVSGKVSVKGAAPKNAKLVFIAKGDLPPEKRVRSADVAADGTYTVKDMFPAEYDVRVEGTPQAGVAPGMQMAAASNEFPVDKNGAPVTKPAKVEPTTKQLDFEF
jgi:hypothetical protein